MNNLNIAQILEPQYSTHTSVSNPIGRPPGLQLLSEKGVGSPFVTAAVPVQMLKYLVGRQPNPALGLRFRSRLKS